MSARENVKSKEPLRACPVCCGAGQADVLYTQRFVLPESHLLPPESDLVACSVCGFVYADTSAGQGVYDAYYAHMSKYEGNYINHDTRLYADTAAWLGKFISDKNAAIIEVGPGNGQLLTLLLHAGFTDLSGLDPSESCVDALCAKGIKGIRGSLFNAPGLRQYDCVILQGVLEHMYDLSRAMDVVRAITRPGGKVFVGVPDAARYREFDEVPYDYFNSEHINHFDEISLVNLGSLHGFSTIGFCTGVLTLAQVEQPVIFCMYQNTGEKKQPEKSNCRDAVLDYIAVTETNRPLGQKIDDLLKTGEQIIVWGAGNFTSRLIPTTGLGKCNIKMFVDNDRNKQGMRILGKTVFPPEALLTEKDPLTIVVVVAVFPDQVLSQIKRMGLGNRIVVLR